MLRPAIQQIQPDIQPDHGQPGEEIGRLQARIEQLEQENASLRQQLEQMLQSEERYRTLFELGMEGFHYVEFDPPYSIDLPTETQCELYCRNLRLVEVNSAFAAMYGSETPEEMIGLKIGDVHVANSEINKAFVRTVVENDYRARNIETEEIDRYGRRRYFLNSGVITVKDGYVVSGWGSQIDITELREAQQALLQAEQQQMAELAKANATLQESLQALASGQDTNLFIHQLLLAIERQFDGCCTTLFKHIPQRSSLQMTHTTLRGAVIDIATDPRFEIWRQEVPEDLTPAWKVICAGTEAFFEINANDPNTWPFSKTWHAAMGHQCAICVPLQAGGRNLGFFGVAFDRDRVSLSQIQVELARAFAQQLTLSLEFKRLGEEAQQTAVLEERNRMAREIHDTLAQAFTGVIVQLEAAKRKISSARLDAAQQHVARARSLSTAGLSEARRSVRALRPGALESCDLSEALHHLAEQMSCDTPVQVTVQIEGQANALPAEVEANLLRIGQEALTNALRHAYAQTIRLELLFEVTAVHLHVIDDGRGFNPKSQLSTGFGLISMQERSQHMNGQFTLTSKIGKGTAIMVSVPV